MLYWETAGASKTFTHPLNTAWLSTVDHTARVLDYGCGYGRLTAELSDSGFEQILGDVVLQTDERNRRRYEGGEPYGVFTTEDGAVCRHHTAGHLRGLFRDFDVEADQRIAVTSMNGNPTAALQLLIRRR